MGGKFDGGEVLATSSFGNSFVGNRRESQKKRKKIEEEKKKRESEGGRKGLLRERAFPKAANSSARRDWPGYEPRSKCHVSIGENFATSIAKHRATGRVVVVENNDPNFNRSFLDWPSRPTREFFHLSFRGERARIGQATDDASRQIRGSSTCSEERNAQRWKFTSFSKGKSRDSLLGLVSKRKFVRCKRNFDRSVVLYFRSLFYKNIFTNGEHFYSRKLQRDSNTFENGKQFPFFWQLDPPSF